MRPSFLIIGAQKGGTTSLYRQLIGHPQVSPPLRKEIHFFDQYYRRGLSWYIAHFPARRRPGGSITGEASPYYLYHPLVPERVARDLPGVRLVVLLRNPVDRAYSHYNHEVRRGHETLSFQEAVEREMSSLRSGTATERLLDTDAFAHRHHSYLSRGIYVEQLMRWMRWMPRESFFICRSEELFRDPESILLQLARFLGLSRPFIASIPRLNAGRYPDLDEALRSRLNAFFAPYNRKLSDLLSMTLDDWQ